MASAQEHWREQTEIYALGALDGQELEEYQTHLASNCALCQAHLRDTQEALNLLPRSLRPLLPPARIKSRLLQIAGKKVVRISPQAGHGRWRYSMNAGMIAAALAGMVVTGAYYELRDEARRTVHSSVINLLRDPTTRDYPLYGTKPGEMVRGRLLWNQSGEGCVFVSSLPAAPEGKMYAMWTIAQASPPRYVGTIDTDAARQGGLHITFGRSDKAVEVFAVTLEPEGSIGAPTGPMVLVSKPS